MKNIFNCTDAQLKAQYKSNAEGLQKMLKRARQTGKKVNGYSEYQLINMVAKYNKLAS